MVFSSEIIVHCEIIESHNAIWFLLFYIEKNELRSKFCICKRLNKLKSLESLELGQEVERGKKQQTTHLN